MKNEDFVEARNFREAVQNLAAKEGLTVDEWRMKHYKCDKCGYPQYHDGEFDDVTKPCGYGNCVNHYCRGCGVWISGAGPVRCRCQNLGWKLRLEFYWADVCYFFERVYNWVKTGRFEI